MIELDRDTWHGELVELLYDLTVMKFIRWRGKDVFSAKITVQRGAPGGVVDICLFSSCVQTGRVVWYLKIGANHRTYCVLRVGDNSLDSLIRVVKSTINEQEEKALEVLISNLIRELKLRQEMGRACEELK